MRFRSSKNICITAVCLFALIEPVGATTVQSFFENREGLKKFSQKSYFPAYQSFMRALQSDPMNPSLHLNLGRALEANKEFEKAEKAYLSALSLLPEDSTLRFETLFNLAGVRADLKRIDDALATYQAALALDPDSLEVKTNIELLMKGSGGGEGQEENQEQQQQKDQNQKGNRGDKPQDKPETQKKKQPKPFESQNLTPEDVKRILDEIKNQEQSIRASEYEKGAKDSAGSRDW